MLLKSLKNRKVVTCVLIIISTLFLMTTFKSIVIHNESKAIIDEYYKSSKGLEVGSIEVGQLDSNYENIYSSIQAIDGVNTSVQEINFIGDSNNKTIELNENFYDTFIKGNIQVGRDLETSDFATYSKPQMTIPVVIGPLVSRQYNLEIGSTYKSKCYTCSQGGQSISDRYNQGMSIGGTSVGDNINQVVSDEDEEYINVTYKVVGIIESNMQIPSVINSDEPGITNLDDAVIIPHLIDKKSLTSEQQDSYEKGETTLPELDMVIYFNPEQISNHQFTKKLSALEKEYGVDLTYISVVSDIVMLQNQASGLVQIMNVSTIFTIILAIVGLIIVVYKDIQSKKQVYIVYILNGKRRSYILSSQLVYALTIQIISNIFCLMIIFLNSTIKFNVLALVKANILYIIINILVVFSIYIRFKQTAIKEILNEVEQND